MYFHLPCSAQDKSLYFHSDHIPLLQLLPSSNLVSSADMFVTFSSMSYCKNMHPFITTFPSVITTFPTTTLFKVPFFGGMRLDFSLDL